MHNVTPLRPNLNPALTADFVRQPHSVELEMAVVGSALVNNALVTRCHWLAPEDFFEPVHGRVWLAAQDAARRGVRTDALLLKRQFDADPGLEEVGGGAVLARLAQAADTILNAVDYARQVKLLARQREMFRIADEMRLRALAPDGEDPAEVIGELRARLDALCLDETRPTAKHISEVIDGLEENILNPPAMWQTGIQALDESFGGGVPAGYVIGIEARMKSFKTGTMHTVLLALARQNIPSCYFALEMGSARLAQRMLGQIGGFNSAMFRHRDNQLLNYVAKARSELDGIPLYFVDRPRMKFSELRARASQLRQSHGVQVNVLDYWQLVAPDEQVSNKPDFLADVAQWCADDAHAHGTTWIIGSQENRQGESYGSDGLAKACDWLGVQHKHELKWHHPTQGPVESLWIDVKHARDSSGDAIGGPDEVVLYIDKAGPHLAQVGMYS